MAALYPAAMLRSASCVLVMLLLTACTSSPQRHTGTPSSAGPSQSAAGAIRKTDWRNASIEHLTFCGESDDLVVFRDGTNDRDVPCRVLPDGAQPVYEEFINEEPANAPATEDALILVELGNVGAARQQALVPIQLSNNGRSLWAWPEIRGDEPNPTGDKVMTFTAYRVEPDQTVLVTVRRLDGGSESRRYVRTDGNGRWERL